MRYDDFVLHIGGRRAAAEGDAYAVRVLQSPAGEGSGLFSPPVGRAQTAGLWARYRGEESTDRKGAPSVSIAGSPAATPRDARWQRAPREELSPEEVGGRLFDAVFREQVRGLYDRSLGTLQSGEEQGLRLKIRLDQEAMTRDDLETLPWELLYRRETGTFLALDRRCSVVRYLDVPQPSKPIPLPERLRVLAVTAEPESDHLSPLELGDELEKLQAAADAVPNWDLEVVPRASVDDLRAACRRLGPFHVIHFMGHGGFDPSSGEGVLYFQHPDGSPQPITGRALAAKLQDLDGLGLVFLNACETAMSSGKDPFSGVACSLVRGGLPAVIAMQRPISDRGAIVFSETFYGALASGLCGDEALVEARQAIHSGMPGSLEWTIPVLFARLREGTLFEPPAPSEPSSWQDRFAGSWRWGAALLALFVLGVWFLASAGGLWSRTLAMPLDQVFATTREGMEGAVRRVELLGDGTMRVYFEFSNGTDEEQKLGFDWQQTYLADENGNPYEVIRSIAGEEARELSVAVPPGESREVWIDVPAPKDGARRFGVALAADESSAAAYPFFEMELKEYGKRYGTRSEAPETLDGAETLAVDTAVESSAQGLDARIARVEMVAGEAMRWSLAMLNRTVDKLGVDFDPRRLVLVDDQGHVYRPRAFGVYGPGAFRQYGIEMRRGLRADPWFEFPAPRAGAKNFFLRLATRDSSGVTFKQANVGLDVSRFAVKDERSWPKNLLPAPVVVPTSPKTTSPKTTSPKTVQTRLLGVYKAPSGGMRWRLEWWNRSETDVKVGLDYPRTRVEDSPGRSYRVERAEPAARVKREGFSATLIPGQRLEGWIELEAPYADAGPLTLVPGNVGGAVRLSKVQIGELPWPGGGRKPPEPPPASSVPPSAGEAEKAEKPTVKRVGTFSLGEGEKEMATTLPGLRVKVLSVDRLSNGRLRWNLEMWNGGSGSARVGFDPGTTKLLQGSDFYRLEMTSLGPPGRASVTRALAPGEPWSLWLEFAGDFSGEETFQLILGSPDPDRYRYRLLEAEASR